MNIFALDRDPAACARAHVDKHVVKMILETAQLLSTAHRVLDPTNVPEGIYKSTHVNHPSAVWVRQTGENYWWTYQLLRRLCYEYMWRYGREHATHKLTHVLDIAPEPLWSGETLSGPLTPVTPAMPDECKLYPVPTTFDESVANYRNYYRTHKADLHRWTRRQPPEWINV